MRPTSLTFRVTGVRPRARAVAPGGESTAGSGPADEGHGAGSLAVDLHGHLAGILSLCAQTKKPLQVSGFFVESIKLVAGARTHLYPTRAKWRAYSVKRQLRHTIAVSRSASKTLDFYDGRSFQEPQVFLVNLTMIRWSGINCGLCHPDRPRFRTWIQTLVVSTSPWLRSS